MIRCLPCMLSHREDKLVQKQLEEVNLPLVRGLSLGLLTGVLILWLHDSILWYFIKLGFFLCLHRNIFI